MSLLWMARVSAAAVVVLLCTLSSFSSAQSSCNYSSQFCGSKLIPFPFGMSSSCGLPDFRINCVGNSSLGPEPLPFLNTGTDETPELLQVLNFSIGSLVVNSTHLKAMPTPANCGTDRDGVSQFALQSDRFVLADDNFFVVVGCNSRGTCEANTSGNGPSTLTCNTGCYNEYALPYCSPYACCITALPPGSRSLNFTGNGVSYKDFPGVCGYSTVLSPRTFIPNEFGILGNLGYYGLNISWGIEQNCSSVKNTKDYECADNSQCVDRTNVNGYACTCNEGYKGDGYKKGLGCEDIDECLLGQNDCEPPPLGRCTNTPGSYNCSCVHGGGSGRRGTCSQGGPSKVMLISVGLGAALFMLFLVLVFAGLRRVRNARRKKEENFRRNGGEGLLQQMSTVSYRDTGRRRLQATLFTPDELQRASNNFSEANKLGSGGFGTVYRGEFSNPRRIVAIKKAKTMQEEAVGQFINEILLLGQVNHPNIVRLLGCCLHTEVPLLVYEYIDNGTLSERLQQVRNGTEKLSWAMRLLIAAQTADALSHLHNTSPPILHRDIKSANILLDQACTSKIADFGSSNFLPSGHTHLSVDMLVFTMGYLDPEYYLESKFTDKSDVYSFGVVLLELITAQPAFSGSPLAQRFFASLQSGEMEALLDKTIVLGGIKEVMPSVKRVAQVATRCLATEGRRRPSMRQVYKDLAKIEADFRGAVKLYTPEERGSIAVGSRSTNSLQEGEDHEHTSLLSSWGRSSSADYPPSSVSQNTSTDRGSSSSLELISFSSSTKSSTEPTGSHPIEIQSQPLWF